MSTEKLPPEFKEAADRLAELATYHDPVESPKPPAGTGETVIILAISAARDGLEMRRALREVKPGAEALIVTEMRDIEGQPATEFVMTGAFRSQRSIRLLLAAETATQRVVPTHTQKGL